MLKVIIFNYKKKVNEADYRLNNPAVEIPATNADRSPALK